VWPRHAFNKTNYCFGYGNVVYNKYVFLGGKKEKEELGYLEQLLSNNMNVMNLVSKF
jgi:hypothetical protein